jgi:hypothetical protein
MWGSGRRGSKSKDLDAAPEPQLPSGVPLQMLHAAGGLAIAQSAQSGRQICVCFPVCTQGQSLLLTRTRHTLIAMARAELLEAPQPYPANVGMHGGLLLAINGWIASRPDFVTPFRSLDRRKGARCMQHLRCNI